MHRCVLFLDTRAPIASSLRPLDALSPLGQTLGFHKQGPHSTRFTKEGGRRLGSYGHGDRQWLAREEEGEKNTVQI